MRLDIHRIEEARDRWEASGVRAPSESEARIVRLAFGTVKPVREKAARAA